MNEDFELFLWIIGLFYLYDCTYWVRTGCVVFLSHLGERHHLHTLHNRALLRNDTGGVLCGNLLPLGTSVQCQYWPVSLAPEGVYSYVAQAITMEGRPAQRARFFRYDDIRTVAQDHAHVLLNGKRFVSCCSPELAGTLALLIEKLCALPPERREAEIEAALVQATDTEKIAERFGAARRTTFVLRLLCTLLFGYLFVFTPLAVTHDLPWGVFGYLGTWYLLLLVAALRISAAPRTAFLVQFLCIGLLACVVLLAPASAFYNVPRRLPYDLGMGAALVLHVGMWLVLAVLTTVEFVRAWKVILPQEGGSLARQVFLTLVWPANTLHARDTLFRSLLSAYHPLAVARVLCRPATFHDFARHVLLDLRHPLQPICPSDDPAVIRTESWFRERLTRALTAVVVRAGIEPDALCQPPARESAECRSYCPRCRGQYLLEKGSCTTCDGVELLPIPVTPPAAVPLPAPPAPPPAVAAPAIAPAPAATRPAGAVRQAKRKKKRKR